MSLTNDERFLFQHNGYHLLRGGLSDEIGLQLIQTIERHAEERIAPVVCEDPDRPGHQKRGDIPKHARVTAV